MVLLLVLVLLLAWCYYWSWLLLVLATDDLLDLVLLLERNGLRIRYLAE
ncbi:hypothetical protein ACFW1P_21780 [Paenibacillus sp. NPDC058910]